MSSKLTRRDAIKALAVAGVVLAAAPYVAKVSGAVQPSPDNIENTDLHSDAKAPLVIVVAENELMGFRGDREFRLDDAALVSQLNTAFLGRGVE